MEHRQPYRYFSRSYAPLIAASPLQRIGRGTGTAFLVSLVTAMLIVVWRVGFAKVVSDPWNLLPDLWFFSLVTALVTLVTTPFACAAESRNARRSAGRLLPKAPLTVGSVLRSRLGISVMIASSIGIAAGCLSVPFMFEVLAKTKSDAPIGVFFMPFMVPTPVMLLLTVPIFALLSRPKATRGSHGEETPR